MKNYLHKLDSKATALLKRIACEADRQGIALYLVGGSVRDLLLGQKNLDLDILIEGDAVQFVRQLAKKLNKKNILHSQFKTATIYFSKDLTIDFASARSETYAKPGDLPKVKFSNVKDDLFRRDFTINALAICLNKDQYGTLIDQHGGLKDLRLKLVRVLHDKSFKDDPTRILRAIRFEQRLGFRLAPATFKLLKNALKLRKEKNVATQRYLTEFKKILSEQYPSKSIVRLDQLNGLKFISNTYKPDVKSIKRIEKEIVKRNDFDVSGKTDLFLLSLFEAQSLKLRKTISAKWQLNKVLKKTFLQLDELDAIIAFLKKKKIAPSEVYKRLNDKEKIFIDYVWLITVSSRVRENINIYLNSSLLVKGALRGDDIRKLGCVDGKKIGAILNGLRFKRMDGLIKSKAQEVKEAKRLLASY